MAESEGVELLELLQNSIEIGETSKGDLYLKSIKRYYGPYVGNWRHALKQAFAMYDEARKQINERKG